MLNGSEPSQAVLVGQEGAALSLARRTYENFSVLSCLVPAAFRRDFAGVYAFCRTADDLADEHGVGPEARRTALTQLRAFRRLLLGGGPAPDSAGLPPVAVGLFGPLHEIIASRGLPIGLFTDLLDAFEQDQTKDRYETWEQVIEYSRRSANPVGRLVLHILEPKLAAASPELLIRSDDICTALQLANFWQDVRRDLLERDRIYLPLEELGVEEWRLREWLCCPSTAASRAAAESLLRPLVDRTRGLFRSGEPLLTMLGPQSAGIIRLFFEGGMKVLSGIERNGFDTLWRRPRVTRAAKVRIIAGVYFGRKSGGTPHT